MGWRKPHFWGLLGFSLKNRGQGKTLKSLMDTLGMGAIQSLRRFFFGFPQWGFSQTTIYGVWIGINVYKNSGPLNLKDVSEKNSFLTNWIKKSCTLMKWCILDLGKIQNYVIPRQRWKNVKLGKMSSSNLLLRSVWESNFSSKLWKFIEFKM